MQFENQLEQDMMFYLWLQSQENLSDDSQNDDFDDDDQEQVLDLFFFITTI